ncbi:hypothetical protein [Actinomycetospora soli]|uniref:hypothetical protein n=1 Tax=Actinomycetospora soli TaxID=2893887 RepID=UPI001E4E1800|nr:hypothetical protein [Actinomycetospora soli]MCD2188172.1 hypothetical protein [Actinomycetospora soli]
MSSDVGTFRTTPIFDEVDRWAHGPAGAGPTMLSFDRARATPGTARTVLALLAAAREEHTPRHALRRS